MRAIRFHTHGGPEVLRLEEILRPEPGAGQALVRVAAAGVNFIDVYHRNGLYNVALPYTFGLEGAGTVEKSGPGGGHALGRRGAWFGCRRDWIWIRRRPLSSKASLPNTCARQPIRLNQAIARWFMPEQEALGSF